MPHFILVLIPYINLLNLSWIIKCLYLWDTEPLKYQDKIKNLEAYIFLTLKNHWMASGLQAM